MAKVEFWLSFNNGKERLRLPVNPPSIEMDSPFGFEDIEVAHLGEVSVFKGRGLKTISFSSFLPKKYNSSYCEYVDIPDPEATITMIERWRDAREPIRLTITGANVNMPVTIREFSYTKEEAGSPGDIKFTLGLKEYRYITFKKFDPNEGKPAPTPTRPGTTVPPTSYTVRKGDNLWSIAKRTYGSTEKWRKIYDANKSVIGGNPNKIFPGQKLVIPK